MLPSFSSVIYIISVIIMIDNGNSSSSVEFTDKYISTTYRIITTENNHHFHCSVKTLFFLAFYKYMQGWRFFFFFRESENFFCEKLAYNVSFRKVEMKLKIFNILFYFGELSFIFLILFSLCFYGVEDLFHWKCACDLF